MPLNESELLQACIGIAQTTSWEPDDPQASSLDANTVKAQAYRTIALRHVQPLEDAGYDPAILIPIINYVSLYAVPPCGDDTNWFAEMMLLMVGFFVPHVEPDDELKAFLTTLRDAIDRSIKSA